MARVAFIGLGNMGGGMAAHLLDNRKEVHCFDPNQDVLIGLEATGAIKAASASDLAAQCDLIILSLPSAAVVRGVMAEITPHLREGSDSRTSWATSPSEPDSNHLTHSTTLFTSSVRRLIRSHIFSKVISQSLGAPPIAAGLHWSSPSSSD